MLCFPMLISSLPDANPLPPEHKIEVFVLFWPPEPTFSGISSTKSAFLCQNWQFSPGFCPFRAQNRHFCAFLGSGTLVFGHFEHKIEVFVRFYPPSPPFRAFRAHNLHFCARGSSRSDVADDTGAMLPLGRCRCSGAELLGR